MCHSMRDEARSIIDRAIQAVLPDEAVFRALKSRPLTGRVLLVAAGKAAWQMANAAHEYLGEQIEAGVVVTKYGHVRGSVAMKPGIPYPMRIPSWAPRQPSIR